MAVRSAVRALVFDVQGTLVDFYQPLLRMGLACNARLGLSLDWPLLATRWREHYREAMDDIIAGMAPWRRVDRIYRDALDRMLDEAGVAAYVSGDDRDAMNRFWSRLDPWPDSAPGLERLRRRYTIATLSNAGMGSLIALVKHAELPFDAILSAELAQAYKPAPSVYRMACSFLDLPSKAVMMVACHKYDLHAAKAAGMVTAFVARPLEFGPDASPDIARDPAFDLHADTIEALADQLGA